MVQKLGKTSRLVPGGGRRGPRQTAVLNSNSLIFSLEDFEYSRRPVVDLLLPLLLFPGPRLLSLLLLLLVNDLHVQLVSQEEVVPRSVNLLAI